MDYSMTRDIGAHVRVQTLNVPAQITAGAGNDGVNVDGPSFDRLAKQGAANGKAPQSVKVAIHYSCALASGETCVITGTLQDSADNSTFATFKTNADADTITVTATTAAPSGVLVGDYNLETAEQYVRLRLNSNLSAATTDTSTIGSVGVLSGMDRLPA